MPPPPEDHPLPPPRPRPKPKPPKPKPPKPKPETMKPEPVRDHQPHAVLPFPPDPFACAAHCSEPCAHHRLCPPPPPSSTATVHLRSSSRLPTPLIALSASVLAVSVLLLLVLLVCHVLRRRRRQNATATSLPLNHQVVEQGLPVDMVVPVPADNDSDDGVHHVWYIRTVGLDERAIAAITALVYDPDKCRALGLGGDGGCAVCLAEFRGGETLRLLPRCGHAFHRGCIDTWLRAHVNCPLCRAPVKVTAGADQAAAPGNDVVTLDGEPAANLVAAAGAGAEEAGVLSTEMAVRRAASMVALPRLPWPDVSPRSLASNSAREGEMGLAKISRVLKSWEELEMASVGVGRSASFRAAPPRLPGRSGQPATGINADEIPR